MMGFMTASSISKCDRCQRSVIIEIHSKTATCLKCGAVAELCLQCQAKGCAKCGGKLQSKLAHLHSKGYFV